METDSWEPSVDVAYAMVESPCECGVEAATDSGDDALCAPVDWDRPT